MAHWRDDLSDEEQAKVPYELQRWLDGNDPTALGLIVPEPGRVKVWARLHEELLDPERGDSWELDTDESALEGFIDDAIDQLENILLTFEEGLDKANNTPYGLSGGVWTDKGAKIFRMTQQIRAGVVWANTFNKFDPTSPFGGYKESGIGREGGLHGLDAYVELGALR